MHKISFFQANNLTKLPSKIRMTWEQMALNSININNIYQSVEWYDHLCRTTPEIDIRLIVVENTKNEIVGIVPIVVSDYYIKFDVYSRVYWKIKLKCVYILGSKPLISNSETDVFTEVMNEIWANIYDCKMIYFDSIPKYSDIWNVIKGYNTFGSTYIKHIPESERISTCIELPDTFEQYNSKFKSKTRRKLTQKIRKMQKSPLGEMYFELVDNEASLRSFLEDAVIVSRNSWQYNTIGERISNDDVTFLKYKDLIDKKIFRSYIIKLGDVPCAFAIGYKYGDMYNYIEIAFDKKYSKYSPGRLLLYMIIEDLIKIGTIKKLSFGIGYSSYKQEFGNHHYKDSSVLLLRKTFSNFFIKICHSFFYNLIEITKSILSKINKGGES